ELAAPEEPKAWESDQVDAKWLWSRFKSPRQFFEGEGKADLRKSLEAILAASLQEWIHEQTVKWIVHYERQWQESAGNAGSGLNQDMLVYSAGKRSSLMDEADLEQLQQLHQQLIHL